MSGQLRRQKKPRYVLIIEDNVHHAELITEVLDRHFSPIIIHTVDKIEDGLEFVSQAVYDLILTGGIIGKLPITSYIPRISKLAGETPLIVISGQGDEKFAADMIKQGASEYLSKTKDTLENLHKILAKHLSKKRKKHKISKKALKKDEKDDSPTPSEIIHEVDRITQQALSIAGTKRRKHSHPADDMEQLDKLLAQIKRLRELTMKLID